MNKWKILVLALSSGERYKNVKNTILRKRSGGAVPQPPVLTFQMDVDRIFSSGYFLWVFTGGAVEKRDTLDICRIYRLTGFHKHS